jgi:hypothetical protein
MRLGLWSKVADHRDPSSLASRLRRRRFATFHDLAASLEGTVRVLDVGGTPGFWAAMRDRGRGLDLDVTILNLAPPEESAASSAQVIVGDARDIRFGDDAFDVVFSNSVIEHVGTSEDQRTAAREMQRVGRRWFVQTPNRHFPIEPHFLFPFFQYLPVEVRARLLSRSRLGWMTRQPDLEAARRVVESVRLLARDELASMFPTSEILEERFAGLVKSYIAVGGWDAPR